MAKRLIDAKALKKLAYPNGYSYVIGENRMVVDVTDIDNAPTVSAVEVVRCEKCKHLMKFNSDVIPVEKAIGTCYIRLVNSNDVQFQAVSADDYCSYGKKESEVTHD